MQRNIEEYLAACAEISNLAHNDARDTEGKAAIQGLVSEQLVDRLLITHTQRHVYNRL